VVQEVLECQPQLCLRKGDHTAMIRLDAINNQSALDSYFILLKEKNSLKDMPSQTFNMDESGIPLSHRSPYVQTRRGREKKSRIVPLEARVKLQLLAVSILWVIHFHPLLCLWQKNINIQ